MTERAQVTFGSPDQWSAFAERNTRFLDRLGKLKTTFDEVFNRSFTDAHQVDSLIFASGHIVVDDFMEILLVCGNAEWFAAQKLLRAMFERVVTLSYLHKHPDEADHYLNYHWITQHKLVNAVETTFKKGLVEPAVVEETERKFKQYRDEYKVTLCGTCGTTRLGIAWSPKDLLTMAREVGMMDLVVPCYYMPLQHAHPTASGMIQRLAFRDGVIAPTERLQPLESDRVLCAAHSLAIRTLDVQVEHFKLLVKLESLVEDFKEIWGSRDDLHADRKKPALPGPGIEHA